MKMTKGRLFCTLIISAVFLSALINVFDSVWFRIPHWFPLNLGNKLNTNFHGEVVIKNPFRDRRYEDRIRDVIVGLFRVTNEEAVMALYERNFEQEWIALNATTDRRSGFKPSSVLRINKFLTPPRIYVIDIKTTDREIKYDLIVEKGVPTLHKEVSGFCFVTLNRKSGLIHSISNPFG